MAQCGQILSGKGNSLCGIAGRRRRYMMFREPKAMLGAVGYGKGTVPCCVVVQWHRQVM